MHTIILVLIMEMNNMKLLMHICCGPCSIYPIDFLKIQNINFEGYFFNPNIHPIEEFQRRKDNAIIVSQKENFVLHISDTFSQDKWANFEGATEERCKMCYDLRLCETARFASENGFDAFSTSLLISPYQNHDLIIQLGKYYASNFSIDFFYSDFRTGFREGQKKAREMGLYCQKYCGCIHSIPPKKA